jgi:hypothetical protein
VAFKADNLAVHICKQCSLPQPPWFVGRRRRRPRSGEVLVERARVGGGLTITWSVCPQRHRAASVSLRLTTTQDGHVEAALYYSGCWHPLEIVGQTSVDRQLLKAHAKAVRERFKAAIEVAPNEQITACPGSG